MFRRIKQWLIDQEKKLTPKEKWERQVLYACLILLLCAWLLYCSSRSMPFVFHP